MTSAMTPPLAQLQAERDALLKALKALAECDWILRIADQNQGVALRLRDAQDVIEKSEGR